MVLAFLCFNTFTYSQSTLDKKQEAKIQNHTEKIIAEYLNTRDLTAIKANRLAKRQAGKAKIGNATNNQRRFDRQSAVPIMPVANLNPNLNSRKAKQQDRIQKLIEKKKNSKQ